MSVIQASSAGVKDMADGSLRITFEFDPRHAAEAFALFGPRGRSVAIAALRDGHAAVFEPESVIPATEKTAIGPLCMLAVRWCNDPDFWDWLETDPENSARSPQGAAACVQAICEVESRKELDTDPDAAERFHRLIRGPFSKYLIARGVVQ